MANEEERLVVLVEARVRDLERNMAKAAGTTDMQFNRMRRSSKTATQQMEEDAIRSSTRINQAFATVGTKIGNFGKAFGGGLIGTVAGLGIAGIVGGLANVAKGVAEVGDEAKRAGVNVKAFQELKYVAEQNRIGVDALTDGLKEMNLRADEFILTGKGSSAEAFQRLGFTAESLAIKLKDPSALFTEIIGKLGQLDKAAQIRIADEIFGGTGGEKFVQLIDQGEAGIRDTIKAANDLGIVMDEQLIERAAEVDRRFNAIANTVGSTLKSAIVSAADSLAEFIDGFRDFKDQQGATLKNRQAELGLRRVDIEAEMGQIRNGDKWFLNPDGPLGKGRLHELQVELGKIAEEEAKIVNVIYDRPSPMTRTGNDTWTPPAYTPPAASKTGSRSSSTSETERERKAVAELIAELEEELRLVNQTDAAKRAAAASRQAGAAATDEERQKVIGLTEAIYQEEEARQRQVDAMEFGRDLTRGAIDDLADGLENNKRLWETLGDVGVNALKRIADTLIDDVLDSIFKVNNAGSSGGGVLSTLFSGIGSFFGGGKAKAPGFLDNGFDTSLPKFAKGGVSTGPSIFGDAGPEAAVPLPDGRRIPVDLGNAGGKQNVNVTAEVRVSVDKNGNLEAFVKNVSTQVVDDRTPQHIAANQRAREDDYRSGGIPR